MWSQAQTGACGTTTPCPLGKADQGHFFERGQNPYVDKREVFDPYGQTYKRIQFEYPWCVWVLVICIHSVLIRLTLRLASGIQLPTLRNFT